MVDIVLQGGIWNITQRCIDSYKKLPFVNDVILSTWSDDPLLSAIQHDKVIINPKPDNRGQCNINMQIQSSKFGLETCKSDTVIKCRTDQLIKDKYFNELYNFYTASCKSNSKIMQLNKIDLCDPIYVWGLNSIFPYCPQDHFFMGSKDTMLRFFSCPLSNEKSKGEYIAYNEHHIQADGNLDWNYTDLRPNIYLGAHFCGLFSKEASKHITDFKEYLVDKAPKRYEALQESSRIRDTIFKVMPRVDIEWEKMPDKKYPFALYESQGEYYYD
jgi:hypothetical protein